METTASPNIKLCDKCEQSCYTCISDLLSAQNLQTFECHFCNLKLSLEELLKLHRDDQKFVLCTNHTSHQSMDQCELHKRIYRFYCTDCRRCLCEKCCDDEAIHTDHCFKKISSVYNSCLKNIDKEFEAYGLYLQGMNGVVEDIRENKIEIIQTKSEITQELNAIIEPEKEAIANQVSEKLEILTIRDEALTKRIEKLEAEKLKLQEQVRMSTKSDLITKKTEIIKRTALMMERPVKDFESDHVPAKIRCVFLPESIVGYVTIEKCSEVIQKENYIESDQMTDLLGTIWSLNLSTGEENFEKILCASLILVDGICGEYVYEIMLMHENNKKSLTFKGNHEFDSKQSGIETRLLSFIEMGRQGFVFNDFLNVKFTIRAPNILKFSQYQQAKIEQDAVKSSVVEEPLRIREFSHKFTIPDFLEYKRRNKIVYTENAIDKLGNNWRLRIHPNGDQEVMEEFVSIYVELMKGIPGMYSFCIGLIDHNSPTIYKIQSEANFKLQEYVGWPKYIRYCDLIPEGYWNHQTDSIDLTFTMSPLVLLDNRRKKVTSVKI